MSATVHKLHEGQPPVKRIDEREEILRLLRTFIRQRPGMDPRNYDWKGYQTERREVHRDLKHAEALLTAVAMRPGITAEMLKAAFRGAFSGRLTYWPALEEINHGGGHVSTSPHGRLDYCTGQYFPTEYRKAVCAVLASALWYYWRAGLPKSPDAGVTYGPKKLSAGAFIRSSAHKEFGRTIAMRYFDWRAEDYH